MSIKEILNNFVDGRVIEIKFVIQDFILISPYFITKCASEGNKKQVCTEFKYIYLNYLQLKAKRAIRSNL